MKMIAFEIFVSIVLSLILIIDFCILAGLAYLEGPRDKNKDKDK